MNKNTLFGTLTLATLLFSVNSFAILVTGQDAKNLYDSMSKVTATTDAGHEDKIGKDINCSHVTADIGDAPVSQDDSSRYSCQFQLKVSPGGQVFSITKVTN